MPSNVALVVIAPAKNALCVSSEGTVSTMILPLSSMRITPEPSSSRIYGPNGSLNVALVDSSPANVDGTDILPSNEALADSEPANVAFTTYSCLTSGLDGSMSTTREGLVDPDKSTLKSLTDPPG